MWEIKKLTYLGTSNLFNVLHVCGGHHGVRKVMNFSLEKIHPKLFWLPQLLQTIIIIIIIISSNGEQGGGIESGFRWWKRHFHWSTSWRGFYTFSLVINSNIPYGNNLREKVAKHKFQLLVANSVTFAIIWIHFSCFIVLWIANVSKQ